jgi:hypothetical protein
MRCIIPGCTKEAHHKLGIRLRRPNTSAIWSPITGTAVCDVHATQGLHITIILEPTHDKQIKTRVCGVAETTINRSSPIRHEA